MTNTTTTTTAESRYRFAQSHLGSREQYRIFHEELMPLRRAAGIIPAPHHAGCPCLACRGL